MIGVEDYRAALEILSKYEQRHRITRSARGAFLDRCRVELADNPQRDQILAAVEGFYRDIEDPEWTREELLQQREEAIRSAPSFKDDRKYFK